MTDVYPQVPGQGGQKGKARKKAGLRETEQGRGGWLCKPCTAHLTPPLRVCPGAELRLTQLFLAGTPQDKIKAF